MSNTIEQQIVLDAITSAQHFIDTIEATIDRRDEETLERTIRILNEHLSLMVKDYGSEGLVHEGHMTSHNLWVGPKIDVTVENLRGGQVIITPSAGSDSLYHGNCPEPKDMFTQAALHIQSHGIKVLTAAQYPSPDQQNGYTKNPEWPLPILAK